jgi:hypothetical protein
MFISGSRYKNWEIFERLWPDGRHPPEAFDQGTKWDSRDRSRLWLEEGCGCHALFLWHWVSKLALFVVLALLETVAAQSTLYYPTEAEQNPCVVAVKRQASVKASALNSYTLLRLFTCTHTMS